MKRRGQKQRDGHIKVSGGASILDVAWLGRGPRKFCVTTPFKISENKGNTILAYISVI